MLGYKAIWAGVITKQKPLNIVDPAVAPVIPTRLTCVDNVLWRYEKLGIITSIDFGMQ
jgi:hypothetical protein